MAEAAPRTPTARLGRKLPRGVAWWAQRGSRSLLELGLLALVLFFVFVVAFLPHLDTFSRPLPETADGPIGAMGAQVAFMAGERPGYPFTIHVDENVHWVRAAAFQRQEKILIDEPYTGSARDETEPFSLRGAVHEEGFQLLLAHIQLLTGVPFVKIFQFLPAFWMAFTAFAMYALVRPHPAALPAAAFVALIPTTPRFLGPAILVPIGFVLAWIPILLILAERVRESPRAAILLAVVLVWAFFVHLIGGFASLLILVVYSLTSLVRDRRGLFALLLVALIPLVWLFNAFQDDVLEEANKEETLPIDFSIFLSFGLLAFAGWIVGLLLLEVRRDRQKTGAMVALGESSLVILAMIVASVGFELNRYATYARWHPPFFLLAAVPLGYLVVSLGDFVRRRIVRPLEGGPWDRFARGAGGVTTGVLVYLLVAPGVSAHASEPYYHVLSAGDWQRFQAVQRLAGPQYQVFLTDPWEAPILSALTGKYPYSWLSPGSPPVRGDDYERVARTGGTPDFFIQNDITLVIGGSPPPATLFHPIAPGVWAMNDTYVQQIAKIRAGERPSE